MSYLKRLSELKNRKNVKEIQQLMSDDENAEEMEVE